MIRAFAVVVQGDENALAVFPLCVDAEKTAKDWRKAHPGAEVRVVALVDRDYLTESVNLLKRVEQELQRFQERCDAIEKRMVEP